MQAAGWRARTRFSAVPFRSLHAVPPAHQEQQLAGQPGVRVLQAQAVVEGLVRPAGQRAAVGHRPSGGRRPLVVVRAAAAAARKPRVWGGAPAAAAAPPEPRIHGARLLRAYSLRWDSRRTGSRQAGRQAALAQMAGLGCAACDGTPWGDGALR